MATVIDVSERTGLQRIKKVIIIFDNDTSQEFPEDFVVKNPGKPRLGGVYVWGRDGSDVVTVYRGMLVTWRKALMLGRDLASFASVKET